MATTDETEATSGPDGKLLLSLVATVVTGIVMFWVSQTQNTSTDLTGLVPIIEQHTRTIDKHDEWITRWPTEGRLAADIAQDTRITFMQEKIADLEADLAALEFRMRQQESRSYIPGG